ncbi:MAG TPA: hypothetical protein VFD87_10585 [Phototrophicaceae bacterium]|nr:hypothetical protein [Phototrophicaceae bacterium]
MNVFSVAALANVAVRASNHELFAGADHVNRDPAFPALKCLPPLLAAAGNVIERPGDI